MKIKAVIAIETLLVLFSVSLMLTSTITLQVDELYLTLDPNSGPPGTSVVVRAYGFYEGESVQFGEHFALLSHIDPYIPLVAIFTVPADAIPGQIIEVHGVHCPTCPPCPPGGQCACMKPDCVGSSVEFTVTAPPTVEAPLFSTVFWVLPIGILSGTLVILHRRRYR